MAASTTRRRFVLGAATAPLLARQSFAQAGFPFRAICIVIGFPPGGGIDILARLIAPKMSERLGQPVIVENRPGANGLIATQGVAQSEADGHTILFGTMGNLAVNQALYGARAGFDMGRDFAPLSQVASLPFVLVVNPTVPAKSLRELIDLAKARPGALFFGSSGNGGLPHLCGELLNLQAAIRTVHVPYRGSAPAFTDLISGQVQFVFDALAIAQHRKRPHPTACHHGIAADGGLARRAADEGHAAASPMSPTAPPRWGSISSAPAPTRSPPSCARRSQSGAR
jgi:tripartite-type tricarboxylate transporter receptor subunit TctC